MEGDIRTLEDVERFRPDARGRLASASEDEIRRGATADVYFVKTLAILSRLGLAGTPVTAEIFASREGLLCGVDECLELLRGRGLEVESLDEGERFSARETVMRIAGPYEAFAVYETALLGILSSASGWATAAREIKDAAGPLPVICFGSRHVHPAVASVMERAAVVGGFDGASNILAARLLERDPTGTIPHACVLIAGDTVRVARAYDEVVPAGEPRTVLVDTFHDEAEEALRVAEALGPRLSAVRLDTPQERGGVTADLVREVRARLDQAGFPHVRIFVSGGLTPARVAELREAGAGGFGVGSYVAAAKPIEMTLDLKEVAGRPLAKRGRIPGRSATERLKRQPV